MAQLLVKYQILYQSSRRNSKDPDKSMLKQKLAPYTDHLCYFISFIIIFIIIIIIIIILLLLLLLVVVVVVVV